MIKKGKSHSASRSPQPAQLDSIERLIEQERYHEAAAKAERLAAEFPHHTRLRDLRIRALAATGETAPATLSAHEWTQEHPHSQRAWSLMFGLANEVGLGFLAFQAHERLDALGVSDAFRTDQAKETIASTRAKYANLDGEEGLRSDLGLLYLINERLDAAHKQLEATTHPVPRTNLAAVMFDQGNMAAAMEIAQAAWLSDRNNSHAARILVRAALYAGDLERAHDAGSKLKTVKTSAPDELAAQLETLDLLEDFDAAKGCFDAFDENNFKDYRRDVVARAKHAAAVAFLQSGEVAKARSLWEQAINDNPDHRLYRLNLANANAQQPSEPAWLEFIVDAFPAVRAKIIEKDIEDAGGGAAIFDDPGRFETELDAHSVYLGRMLRLSDPLFRTIVREELAKRLDRSDAVAERELRGFLTYAFGSDEERIEALRALYFANRIPRVSEVDIFLRRKQRRLSVSVPVCTYRRALLDLPNEAITDYVKAVFASEPTEVRTALTKIEQWADKATHRQDQLALAHRSILLLHALRGKETDAQEKLRDTLASGDALARTFAFAARLAISRGDLDQAAKLLEGQLARAGTHDEDVAPVLFAEQELHAARKEEDQELTAWLASEVLGAFENEMPKESAAAVQALSD